MKPRSALRVHGGDFDTPDGTCVRDYVHVHDLCRAHRVAIDRRPARLVEGRVEGAEAYNLGIGRGFSVREVIDVCRSVTAIDIGYQVEGRRAGDTPRLVANAAKACEVLGWVAEYQDNCRLTLGAIIGTAWRYMDRA